MLTVTGVLIILALCGVFGCRYASRSAPPPRLSEREILGYDPEDPEDRKLEAFFGKD